jgi:hypothetical protein
VENPSLSIETGILKLFVSDVYVDMNHIAQRPVHEIIAVACAEEVAPAVRSGPAGWSRESPEPWICGMSLASVVVKTDDAESAK